eukprot:NODE_1985_length_1314_cov_32.959562_g1888_i0.p1 GENE.NODE_1985_length_1314_cov_32.959562_g1888_i0~~NODE_1985_length_1314_cov_32.959562_g1888_i0.p1  ORF type:complete len:435 (+),score=102.34 NODE_1985_length_1314_cov_32.959562_g1888_i0:80-1306(+)
MTVEAVAKQLEFYFSDSALAKDRFLRRHLETEGAVPADLFLKFNRVSALTSDVEVIKSAATLSPLLCLSAVGSISRTSPIVYQDPRYYEARTVYVEGIPPDSTHETLGAMFGEYGAVTFVTIPKDTTAYAFIEFELVESTLAVVEACPWQEAQVAWDNLKDLIRLHNNPSALSTAGLRALTKQEWTKRQSEYQCLIEALKPPVEHGLIAKLKNVRFPARPDLSASCPAVTFSGDSGADTPTPVQLDVDAEPYPVPSPSACQHSDPSPLLPAANRREQFIHMFNTDIPYVDTHSDMETFYLRFVNPEAALKAQEHNQTHNHADTFTILHGLEEKIYWERMELNQHKRKRHQASYTFTANAPAHKRPKPTHTQRPPARLPALPALPLPTDAPVEAATTTPATHVVFSDSE